MANLEEINEEKGHFFQERPVGSLNNLDFLIEPNQNGITGLPTVEELVRQAAQQHDQSDQRGALRAAKNRLIQRHLQEERTEQLESFQEQQDPSPLGPISF